VLEASPSKKKCAVPNGTLVALCIPVVSSSRETDLLSSTTTVSSVPLTVSPCFCGKMPKRAVLVVLEGDAPNSIDWQAVTWTVASVGNFMRQDARHCNGTKRKTRTAAFRMVVNVEFSRHAARKLMVARYRRMPHGRLEFIVGTSFAATDLLQLTATFRLRHSHCRAFGFAGDNNFTIAALRQILSCVRHRANLEIANSHSAKPAAIAKQRAPKAIQLPDAESLWAAFASATTG
jgi:hypothetical protein